MSEKIKKLSNKWQTRFDIIDQLPTKSYAAFAASLKTKPFKDRFFQTIRMASFLAFFFGPIYFLILGMWRKAIFISGLYLLSLLITVFIFSIYYGDPTEEYLNLMGNILKYETIALALICSFSATYDYYEKIRYNDKSWLLTILKKPKLHSEISTEHDKNEMNLSASNGSVITDGEMDKLLKLHELKQQGILTEAEYEIEKKKII